MLVEADLESYGATERQGQRRRHTRDGNRERWRQVERDREKETDPCTERRETDRELWGRQRKGQRREKLCRNCGPEGDRLDEATVAAGWAGEPALKMCGPKQLEGAGEPDSRTWAEVAVGSGGTVAWGDRAGGVEGALVKGLKQGFESRGSAGHPE